MNQLCRNCKTLILNSIIIVIVLLLSLPCSYVLGLTDGDLIESLTEHVDLIVAWCHQYQNINYMNNNNKIEWKRYSIQHLYYYYCFCG